MTLKRPDFTPILIRFTSAVRSPDALITERYTEHKLRIVSQPSTRLDDIQTLPQEFYVTVPFNGELKLELLRSGGSPPLQRYRVTYYADNKETGEQYWVIPPAPVPITHSFTVVNGVYELPDDVFAIDKITPEVEYSIEAGVINIATDGDYVIVYQPAVTLNDIVVDE